MSDNNVNDGKSKGMTILKWIVIIQGLLLFVGIIAVIGFIASKLVDKVKAERAAECENFPISMEGNVSSIYVKGNYVYASVKKGENDSQLLKFRMCK